MKLQRLPLREIEEIFKNVWICGPGSRLSAISVHDKGGAVKMKIKRSKVEAQEVRHCDGCSY